MFTWCAILFFLGIAAFMDTIFNYGNIFRQINSVLFMLISLALLIRTTSKIKLKTKEKFEQKVHNLESQVESLKADEEKRLTEY